MLTNEELKAIERDAETYSKNKMSGWGRIYSVSPKHYMKTGFIEGVKQERIKAKALLTKIDDAMDWINHGNYAKAFNILAEAKHEYEYNTKQIEP